jgi:hypothetical protein
MTTFLSSAFLQQCFAMHRYDLVVKRVTPSGAVVTCRACKIRHAVRLGAWDSPEAQPEQRPSASIELLACATDHLGEVCVQTVDVQRDHVELACRRCRGSQPLRIIECVTRALTNTSGL